MIPQRSQDVGYIGCALIVVCLVLIAITWLELWQPVFNILALLWGKASW